MGLFYVVSNLTADRGRRDTVESSYSLPPFLSVVRTRNIIITALGFCHSNDGNNNHSARNAHAIFYFYLYSQ